MNKREKLRREIIRDFTFFLKKENIYIRYRVNIARYKGKGNIVEGYQAYFYGVYTKKDAEDLGLMIFKGLISSAFPWALTKEKRAFWENVNKKWVAFFMMKYPPIIK